MVADKKIWSVDEYIQHELQSERRHEFINGQLFEMPGEKGRNNILAGLFYVFFLTNLGKKGYQAYINDVKIAIPNQSKYYYPDVFVTAEEENQTNEYIKYQPEIIVEVLSKSTHITDTVDKYIDYTKIPSLKYYLIAEPEIVYVTLYSKNIEGNWEADIFTNVNSIISMPLLAIEIPLKEIYSI